MSFSETHGETKKEEEISTACSVMTERQKCAEAQTDGFNDRLRAEDILPGLTCLCTRLKSLMKHLLVNETTAVMRNLEGDRSTKAQK